MVNYGIDKGVIFLLHTGKWEHATQDNHLLLRNRTFCTFTAKICCLYDTRKWKYMRACQSWMFVDMQICIHSCSCRFFKTIFVFLL